MQNLTLLKRTFIFSFIGAILFTSFDTKPLTTDTKITQQYDSELTSNTSSEIKASPATMQASSAILVLCIVLLLLWLAIEAIASSNSDADRQKQKNSKHNSYSYYSEYDSSSPNDDEYCEEDND